jgi:hypothetical protein
MKKRRDIARKLVKHLEKKALSFREVQRYVYKLSNNISIKEKVDVSRGYWCSNITQLFNSLTIGKHPKYGYFALPGTSKQERMFSKEVEPWHMKRYKNDLHLKVLMHPGIKKRIEKDDILHNYI